MNLAVHKLHEQGAMPQSLVRVLWLLEGNRLGQVVARAAETLCLDRSDAAKASVCRLHPRSHGGFVLDVSCGSTMVFVESASSNLRDLSGAIVQRHRKQQSRLRNDQGLLLHVDVASDCIVRLKGQDELIDGLPATLLQGRFGREEVADARLFAHRLNRRAVIGITKGDGTKAVIKAYKKGSQKADVAVALHEMLGKTAFNERSSVCVPKVVNLCSDWPGYMMEHVPGTAVTELAGSARQNGMRLAGEALGRLHRMPLRLECQYSAADELRMLHSWVLLTSQLFPHRTRRLNEAFTHVSRMLAASEGEVGECIVHRDFHGGQVLASAETASLVDFDTACNGEPAQDIGNFLAHLDFDELQQRVEFKSDGETFLTAYETTHAPYAASRVRAHRAATLLRLSCIHSVSINSRIAAEAMTERVLSL